MEEKKQKVYVLLFMIWLGASGLFRYSKAFSDIDKYKAIFMQNAQGRISYTILFSVASLISLGVFLKRDKFIQYVVSKDKKFSAEFWKLFSYSFLVIFILGCIDLAYVLYILFVVK
ncbi:MAG: hypothetical protein WC552_08485 [Candidatus Omnitrophota bacterium]